MLVDYKLHQNLFNNNQSSYSNIKFQANIKTTIVLDEKRFEQVKDIKQLFLAFMRTVLYAKSSNKSIPQDKTISTDFTSLFLTNPKKLHTKLQIKENNSNNFLLLNVLDELNNLLSSYKISLKGVVKIANKKRPLTQPTQNIPNQDNKVIQKNILSKIKQTLINSLKEIQAQINSQYETILPSNENILKLTNSYLTLVDVLKQRQIPSSQFKSLKKSFFADKNQKNSILQIPFPNVGPLGETFYFTYLGNKKNVITPKHFQLKYINSKNEEIIFEFNKNGKISMLTNRKKTNDDLNKYNLNEILENINTQICEFNHFIKKQEAIKLNRQLIFEKSKNVAENHIYAKEIKELYKLYIETYKKLHSSCKQFAIRKINEQFFGKGDKNVNLIKLPLKNAGPHNETYFVKFYIKHQTQSWNNRLFSIEVQKPEQTSKKIYMFYANGTVKQWNGQGLKYNNYNQDCVNLSPEQTQKIGIPEILNIVTNNFKEYNQFVEKEISWYDAVNAKKAIEKAEEIRKLKAIPKIEDWYNCKNEVDKLKEIYAYIHQILYPQFKINKFYKIKKEFFKNAYRKNLIFNNVGPNGESCNLYSFHDQKNSKAFKIEILNKDGKAQDVYIILDNGEIYKKNQIIHNYYCIDKKDYTPLSNQDAKNEFINSMLAKIISGMNSYTEFIKSFL